MSKSELFVMLIGAASVAATAAIVWAAAAWSRFVRARVDNEYMQGVLLRLDETAERIVLELEQSVVKPLKESGSWNDDVARQIRDAAVAKVKEYLGEKGISDLLKILGVPEGTLHDMIVSFVEAAVARIRLAI